MTKANPHDRLALKVTALQQVVAQHEVEIRQIKRELRKRSIVKEAKA